MRDYPVCIITRRRPGTTQKLNESASWHLENNLICHAISGNINLQLFYPCTQVRLIISCDRRVLKSSLQSAPIRSFLCALINLFFPCSPGVSEWVEMWKLVRGDYRLKLQQPQLFEVQPTSAHSVKQKM